MAEHSLGGFLQRLGNWDGFVVQAVEMEDELKADAFGMLAGRIIIVLEPVADQLARCSRCGAEVAAVHDVSVRRVRDLPMMGRDTWLEVPRRRLACPQCGPTVEAVSWLDRYQRMTTRLADLIAQFARLLPIAHVATLFRMDWDTVKQIDLRAMAARLGPVDAHWDTVRHLTIDECAIERGHRYATVVVDPDTKRVLWVARGRDEAALEEFFTRLGPRCAQIAAVAVDMGAPYAAQVRRHCPQAKLVYDLFHVVAKYGHEVIDRVRVDETNRLARAAGPGPVRAQRRVIKGARWLLLRNRESVAPRDRVRLRELLQANRALFIVYVLKEDLKHLWHYRSRAAAARWWQHWRRRALASRLPALHRFVRMLDRHLDGVLNHCHYPLHTGLLEGINNKIKVIKRSAYGFRDDHYFFLKIRAAFPGIT